MSKRSRKVAQRQQRNADQQDITKPTRRVTSSYVKRLMMKYHEKHIAPLAADVAASSTIFGAFMRLALDKGIVTEEELAEKLRKSDVPA